MLDAAGLLADGALDTAGLLAGGTRDPGGPLAVGATGIRGFPAVVREVAVPGAVGAAPGAVAVIGAVAVRLGVAGMAGAYATGVSVAGASLPVASRTIEAIPMASSKEAAALPRTSAAADRGGRGRALTGDESGSGIDDRTCEDSCDETGSGIGIRSCIDTRDETGSGAGDRNCNGARDEIGSEARNGGTESHAGGRRDATRGNVGSE